MLAYSDYVTDFSFPKTEQRRCAVQIWNQYSHTGITLTWMFVYSLQVACATFELVFLLRVRQMKAPASISFERSTPWERTNRQQQKKIGSNTRNMLRGLVQLIHEGGIHEACVEYLPFSFHLRWQWIKFIWFFDKSRKKNFTLVSGKTFWEFINWLPLLTDFFF